MMITTRDLKRPAKVEPKKLNIITSAIIPDVVPQPAPIGDGFAKMITTNDEPKPKVAPAVVEKSVTEPILVTPEQFAQLPADEPPAPDRDVDDHSKDAPVPVPPAKRKPAQRKKKAKA